MTHYPATPYEAVAIVDGLADVESHDVVIEAWQFLIDPKIVWQMPGRYGRQAASLLDQGICVQRHEAARIPKKFQPE